ncbi:MAG TPA: hypothetical protein VGM05_32215 [Planctomycetaceae bacterium]|jgi:hypothetical protein
MAEIAPNPTPSEPRRFPIGLPRPLWIGLVTVVVAVAGVGLRIGISAYRQQVAIREINRLGGTIYRPSRVPLWLSSKGIQFDFLDQVEAVDLTGADIDDGGMKFLRDFPELEILSLWGTRVSDSGLRNVESLTKLVELDAACTTLSDEGLIHLKGLTNLRHLKLHRTHVTDAGVTELKQALPELDVFR